MTTGLVKQERVAVDWRLGRDDAEQPNPAGPLFLSGRFAPSEITAFNPTITPACPTLQWTPCNSWCLECGPIVQ